MAKALEGEALIEKLIVEPGKRTQLSDGDAASTHGWDKLVAKEVFDRQREELSKLQEKLYADGRFALLVVLQATDGGGKDSTVRDVFTSMNPQGCVVTSFKQPTSEELKHDYLWRVHKHVPARGMVGVFNRSHYEDVLVVRVDNLVPRELWSMRYAQINDFERMLSENSVRIVKLFLHISKDEQKKRLEERINEPEKNWKFSADDAQKRKQWDDYEKAFEAMLSRCSTEWAPWYVIPADYKWFRNVAVTEILLRELRRLSLRYPRPAFDPSTIRIR